MSTLWFESDLVCCVCHKKLLKDSDNQLYCPDKCCNAGYLKNGILYVLPQKSVLSQKYDKKFDAWTIVQKQAVPLYENEPTTHLAIEGNPREEYLEKFGEFCKLSGKVIDIGCGPSGKIPVYLKNAGILAGVDPIPGNASKEIPFCNAMGEFLPFPDAYFDNMTMTSVLDHVLNPDLVVAEAQRVLVPSGRLHICVNISDRREKKLKALIKKILPQKLISLILKIKHRGKNFVILNTIIPDGAKDSFHMEFFSERKIFSLLSRRDLELIDFKKLRINRTETIWGLFSVQKKESQ